MVITGNNLRDLIRQHGIVSDFQSFDTFSISLSLSEDIAWYKNTDAIVSYEEPLDPELVTRAKVEASGLILEPQSCILACSHEDINIPPGYIGFIQTKGSLARLFVSAHCSDSQIETGYKGKITFELINSGKLRVRLKYKSKIAQLFLFKTSQKNPVLYNGKYNNAVEPTTYKW